MFYQEFQQRGKSNRFKEWRKSGEKRRDDVREKILSIDTKLSKNGEGKKKWSEKRAACSNEQRNFIATIKERCARNIKREFATTGKKKQKRHASIETWNFDNEKGQYITSILKSNKRNKAITKKSRKSNA